MKILFLQWKCVVEQKDLEDAFVQEGHSLVSFWFSPREILYGDPSGFEKNVTEVMQKEHPDIVFTVNYYPVITNICSKRKIKYVSWVYDSPFDWMYFKEIMDPCNLVYTFDKELAMEFHSAGINTVQYLPMAVNTDRLDILTEGLPMMYNVSFVGNFYKDADFFSQKRSQLSDYTKGYLDAVKEAQLRISGYSLVSEVIGGAVLDELSKVYLRYPIPGDLRTDKYFMAESVINPWITCIERMGLLETAAKNFGLDLFSKERDFILPNLNNRGPVSYCDEMPKVFRQSRINLNISRRGMRSAVPLRCFDVMGSGGFLLSNFQSGFLDMFVPDQDFVFYDSKEDFVQKIGYYLAHEDERAAIAKNGHDKVAAKHTYRHRVREMFNQ